MYPKRTFALLLTLLTLLSLPAIVPAQRLVSTAARAVSSLKPNAPTAAEIPARLDIIEKAVDAKRQELHIPGAALVIVKDDKIIYIKGFGMRDVAQKLPVTPQTMFAIGSSSKAFTAMTVMMCVDEKKLALTDSPKKYYPTFKLRDPDADSKITISDILSHRSGLPRIDLPWYTGKLTSDEAIRVAGIAKPTAKLGQTFQYQNIMFLLAGQIVAKLQGKPWTEVVAARIFKPLGMKDANCSVPQMLKYADHALGYEYKEKTKQTLQIPMRPLPSIAPAGAINANAQEMAQWLRLLLGHGVYAGKRLLSDASFDELITPKMKIGGNVSYGLGWFLREWNGHKVVEHGGNIDGFNAQVAFMPDQKLGLVLLTNVSASPLGFQTMDIVWENLVGKPKMPTPVAAKDAPTVDPASETGTYHLAEANIDFSVVYKDGKLVLMPPGQTPAVLIPQGGRRYKPAPPIPDGFFVTFRPVAGKPQETELFLEQPQGSVVLQKVTAKPAENAPYDGPFKELIGKYRHDKSPEEMEITVRNGKVSLVAGAQPPYPLVEKAKDQYSLGGLPDTFMMTVKRDASGSVTAFFLKQPQGDVTFERIKTSEAPIMTAEALMTKVIEASGGEANLRKHKSVRMRLENVLENQGMTAQVTIYGRAPNLRTTETVFLAVGKKIGTEREYFDGKNGGTETSFSPSDIKTGDDLIEAAKGAVFAPELEWKTLYKTVTVKRTTKVGEEEVYVVEMKPEKGSTVTEYISTTSFRVIQRDVTTPVGAISSTLSDYRLVDGVYVPYKMVQTVPSLGEVVITVKEVKFDVPIPDSVYQPTKK